MSAQNEDDTAFIVSVDDQEAFVVRRQEVLDGVKSFVGGISPTTKIEARPIRLMVGRQLDRTVDRAAMEVIRGLSSPTA